MYFGFIITWGFQNLANKLARNVNFFRYGPSNKKESILVICVPHACQLYVWWPPLGVSRRWVPTLLWVHVWVGYPWTYPLPLDIPTLPQGTYDQRYQPPSPWKDMGPGIPTRYGQNDWQTPVKTFWLELDVNKKQLHVLVYHLLLGSHACTVGFTLDQLPVLFMWSSLMLFPCVT